MLWFAHREDGFEAHSIATLTSLGIPVERVDPAGLGERWPQVATDDLAFAAYEPEAGLLRARAAVLATVAAFTAAGGRLAIAEVWPGIEADGRLVDLVATDGTHFAGATFVFAAGPWLPRLFPRLLGDAIAVTKQDVSSLDRRVGRPLLGRVAAVLGRLRRRVLRGPRDGRPRSKTLPIATARRSTRPTATGSSTPTRSVRSGATLVDASRTWPMRRSSRRGSASTSRPDTEFILDRHPELENVWIAVAVRACVQARPGHREYLVSRSPAPRRVPIDARFSLTRTRQRGAHLRTGAHTVAD